MSALRDLLATFRAAAKTNREAGTYFEELVVQYLRHEPAYRDLYRSVEPYADFAKRNGLDATDTGIDLVAETVDLLVYRRIRASGYATAAIASNLASSLIDSALFLGLAFGAAQALHGTLGLTLGKVGSSTITVVIMLVIVRRVRHPSDPVGTAPICLSEPWWR